MQTAVFKELLKESYNFSGEIFHFSIVLLSATNFWCPDKKIHSLFLVKDITRKIWLFTCHTCINTSIKFQARISSNLTQSILIKHTLRADSELKIHIIHENNESTNCKSVLPHYNSPAKTS